VDVHAEVFGVVAVAPPAEGGVAAYQIDGFIDAKVDERCAFPGTCTK